jgi:hypothetical protein
LLASLLVVGTIGVAGFGAGGLGTGVVVTSAAATPPGGAGAATEDVSESTFATSTRRRAARRTTTSRPFVGGGARPIFVQVPTVERPLDRWLRLAPPSWRGPPVLLI